MLSPVGFLLNYSCLSKEKFPSFFCLCKITDNKMRNFHAGIIFRNHAALMFFLKIKIKMEGERERTGHVLRKGTIESSVPLKAPKKLEKK